MNIQGLGFLPCLWSLWTYIGLMVCFISTIALGHADTYVIYVSTTGDYPPESILFGVVSVTSAILGAAIAYITYRFHTIHMADPRLCFKMAQIILLVMALMSATGSIVTGVFPSVTYPMAHRVGAGAGFVLGGLYNLGQAICLYWTSVCSRRSCHLRLGLAIITTVDLLIFGICKCLGFFHLCQASFCDEKIIDLIAIGTEWVGLLLLLAFPMSLFIDLQHLAIQKPKRWKDDWIIVRERLQDSLPFP